MNSFTEKEYKLVAALSCGRSEDIRRQRQWAELISSNIKPDSGTRLSSSRFQDNFSKAWELTTCGPFNHHGQDILKCCQFTNIWIYFRHFTMWIVVLVWQICKLEICGGGGVVKYKKVCFSFFVYISFKNMFVKVFRNTCIIG